MHLNSNGCRSLAPRDASSDRYHQRSGLTGVRCLAAVVRLAILFFLLAAAQLSAAEAPVLEEIREHFKKLNPDIQSIQLQDVKPRHTQYWVLARGIREDEHFRGSLEDELFGLFVIDVRFTNVLRVVDIFPTNRWNDFRVWIDSYGIETIVVKGEGATYEDQPMMREYAVPW